MKKILSLALVLCIFSSSHAAWYDAPLRWFNQGISWFRQRSYDAYQKALALAGYRAYQQSAAPISIAGKAPKSNQENTVLLIEQLSPDIDAAVIAAQLLTILEQQWHEEIQQKNPRYPELLQKEQMSRYPALKQAILIKHPELNALSKYSVIIPIINDPSKDQNILAHFPSLVSILNNFPLEIHAQREAKIRDLIIWLARIKEYFDDPFASQYSLSTIIEKLKTFSPRFERKMDPTLE